MEGLTRLGAWMPFHQAAKLLGDFWQVPVSEATARRQHRSDGAAYVGGADRRGGALEREQPVGLAAARRCSS